MGFWDFGILGFERVGEGERGEGRGVVYNKNESVNVNRRFWGTVVVGLGRARGDGRLEYGEKEGRAAILWWTFLRTTTDVMHGRLKRFELLLEVMDR